MPPRNPRVHARTLFVSAAAVLAATGTVSAQYTPYTLTRIGLFDGPEFTRTDGFQETSGAAGSIGRAAGISRIYAGSFSRGWAAWVHDAGDVASTRVGLFTGPEFTSPSGQQDSGIGAQSSSGHAAGRSRRYIGSMEAGFAVWAHAPAAGASTRIGFFDGPEFTRADGTQVSTLFGLSGSGHAAGDSTRYVGSVISNRAAWVHAPGAAASTRVGFFTGAEFTRNDGTQTSTIIGLSDSGHVAGQSQRFVGSGDGGSAAWVHNPDAAASIRIGLFSGSEFTRASGMQVSFVSAVSSSGHVAGGSDRYSGADAAGRAAWVHAPGAATSTRVGLFTGAEFTRGDGRQFSSIAGLNSGGYAAGQSERYAGSSAAGQAAWVHAPGADASVRVGLFTAPEFTRTDLLQFSSVSLVGSGGHVAGQSQRYMGLADRGFAAWVHAPGAGASTRVGLFTGPEYSRADGWQGSTVLRLSGSGHAAGVSTRFAGSSEAGRAAWIHAFGSDTSTRVGLFADPVFTSASGVQWSSVSYLTDDLATGTSRRYTGDAEIGQSGWAFDFATATTHDLTFSVRHDGYAFTSISLLTDSGLVLGLYDRFDGAASLGFHAFVWSPGGGFADLGDLVDGGISTAGFARLSFIASPADLDFIVGNGVLTTGGTGAFLLTPVPAPGSVVLLSLTTLLGLRRRR